MSALILLFFLKQIPILYLACIFRGINKLIWLIRSSMCSYPTYRRYFYRYRHLGLVTLNALAIVIITDILCLSNGHFNFIFFGLIFRGGCYPNPMRWDSISSVFACEELFRSLFRNRRCNYGCQIKLLVEHFKSFLLFYSLFSFKLRS